METKSQHTPGPWIAGVPAERYITKEGVDITTYSVYTKATRHMLREAGHSHYKEDPGSVDNVAICDNQFLRDMKLEEGQANAHLMAAAPDLLEACEKVKQFLHEVNCRFSEDAEYGSSCLDTIDAAIAKATE